MGYHQLNAEERLELYRLRRETNLLVFILRHQL